MAKQERGKQQRDGQDQEGLSADLTRIERLALGRRRLLSLGAMGGLAALTGCAAPERQAQSGAMGAPPWGGPGGPPPPNGQFGPPPGGIGGGLGGGPGGPPPQIDNGPVVTGTAPDGTRCVAFTRETEGPFPADGSNGARGTATNVLGRSGLQRQDIRGDIGGGHAAEGITLDLSLRLVDVNTGCAPLAGYAVYVWHCDANGQYSLYDQPERSWLRGLQVTDETGLVRFRTIVPGCYMGRYPHIHFEAFTSLPVATAGKFARLTSQLALPAGTCEAAYDARTYARSVQPWGQSRDIGRDMVFGDNGAERIKVMTLNVSGSVASGFRGEALIGLPG